MSSTGTSITGDGRAAIEKTIFVNQSSIFANIGEEELEHVFELGRCSGWIIKNGFKRICLQFPDEYLSYSSQIVEQLSKSTNREYFILADSTYGSCCVDEKTAQHVPDADSIIHFGPSCLSSTSGRFPVLYIYTKPPVNIATLEKVFRANFNVDENVLILFDVVYDYAIENFFTKVRKDFPLTKKSSLVEPSHSSVPNDSSSSGIVKHNRRIPYDSIEEIESCKIFYVGQRSLPNLLLALPTNTFKVYDPTLTGQESVSVQTSSINRLIRKRSFYVEKIKDVTSVGILVGTLVVQNYLDLIDRLKKILRKAGKKYYVVSIGEINPCKLGNFMDIECFVFVGCPEVVNYYISDESKGQFFQPILTPYDVELAFCEGVSEKWGQEYVINWSFLVQDGDPIVKQIEEDVSLITGGMRAALINTSSEIDSGFGVVNWRGLSEKEEVVNDPSKVYEGRSGVAASYADEPSVNSV